MKTTLRYFKGVVIILMGLVGTYIFLAVILSLIPTNPPEFTCDEKVEFYIADNGVHLDIVLPVETLDDNFLENTGARSNTRYISFGWGDLEFYINTPEWGDIKFTPSFNALFVRSESTMHLGYFTKEWSHWKKVLICPEQMAAMQAYISGTFKKDRDSGFVIIEEAGYSANDAFYEAHGSFWFYRTCNVWVNQALKQAKVRTSLWSPFKWGVRYHLED